MIESHSNYYLPKVEIKDYNVMIHGKNLFYQTINSNLKMYDNIKKNWLGWLWLFWLWLWWLHNLEYSYFNNCYKMIAIGLSKQQVFDADPSTIQRINFTAKLNRDGNTKMFFINEEVKETVLSFSQRIR